MAIKSLQLLFLLTLSVFFTHQNSYAQTETENHRPLMPSMAPILKQSMPAIVNISIQGELPAVAIPNERGEINKLRPRKFTSLGSGVIIDAKKGYLITNAHVVNDAKTITVTLHDSRHLKAKVIGTDPNSDVAVLQIEPDHLETLTVGDSNSVEVGDFVIAIGNPFGINISGNQPSATFGIVSAVQRSDLHIEGVENFIQTDAAINPGNSGGALINMKGELVGINTAIISPLKFSGNVGIGLAIPINMVQEIAKQLIKYGSIHRGLMGIFVQDLTPELASAFNLANTKGALIAQVNKDSPAEKAGLRAGDILQRVNNNTIENASQVKNIIHLLRVNSKVSIELLRNGKSLRIETTVADVKKHEEEQQAQNPFLFGLALEDFDQSLPLHGHIKGVRLVGATENSVGWRAGLRPGDVIVDTNQHATPNIETLNKFAHEAKDKLLLHVIRDQAAIYLVVK